jgi:hypothetical protein
MWFLSQALEGSSPSRILEQIEGFLNNLPRPGCRILFYFAARKRPNLRIFVKGGS